jgi:hypothetical protein
LAVSGRALRTTNADGNMYSGRRCLTKLRNSLVLADSPTPGTT